MADIYVPIPKRKPKSKYIKNSSLVETIINSFEFKDYFKSDNEYDKLKLYLPSDLIDLIKENIYKYLHVVYISNNKEYNELITNISISIDHDYMFNISDLILNDNYYCDEIFVYIYLLKYEYNSKNIENLYMYIDNNENDKLDKLDNFINYYKIIIRLNNFHDSRYSLTYNIYYRGDEYYYYIYYFYSILYDEYLHINTLCCNKDIDSYISDNINHIIFINKRLLKNKLKYVVFTSNNLHKYFFFR